jgi:hypothetical protein
MGPCGDASPKICCGTLIFNKKKTRREENIMKTKHYIAALVMLLIAVPAFADDGELTRVNVSKTPALHTEHGSMKMLSLYVPAQTSTGDIVPVEYFDANGALVETRSDAKPLISFYADGHVEEVEDGGGFSGHGNRDIYGAVSLDDSATWKRSNLSKSGDESSFTLKNGTAYPGDVVRLFDAAAGNTVMAVWASRYCRGGAPNYAMDDEQRAAIADQLGITTEALYLNDLFGVSGSQKSSDFSDEGYPTVGEVPYSCLWAARGTLEPVNDLGEYDINGTQNSVIWRQAERLTSGVRDVHRMEVAAEAGIGFVVTWQEDPDGLRPGDGEGPGEGWSGAVAHHQTDIWYSYITWDNFLLVAGDQVDGYGDPIELSAYEGDGTPMVGIPLSMPVRLTDNAMCQKGENEELIDNPYCYEDFNNSGTADFCAETVPVTVIPPENVGDPAQATEETLHLCVTEDGRLLRGNIASTRARTNLRAYDTDGDGINDSAWVITAYEESKGLGEEEFDAGTLTDAEVGKMDMGKNIWYHTFDMFSPELVSQGMILNAPAIYPDDYVIPKVDGNDVLEADGNYMKIEPDPIYEYEGSTLETDLYQTEIARRFSLISQKGSQVATSRTSAFTTWKQGIKRQGGPADVMARRFVAPDTFDPAVDNPYDYANMACIDSRFTDGSNPRYIRGLCMDQAINLSGTSIINCNNGTVGQDCADLFPWNERFDDIDMTLSDDALAKVIDWVQTGPDFGGDLSVPGNVAETSWENPYDVAKGHRGYIDGDFIMVLYAWSPNWLANTVGHDNYNLYIRRSFDGGQTWTTTPNASPWTSDTMVPEGVTVTADGTTTCESMGPAGGATEYEVCTTYGAGEFEQARNVSQLVGTGETVLDPRYAPTSPLKTSILTDGSFLYDDDERDPSKFFAVFETGDNTTVEFGEAEPLDLFYSRAFNWGDDYELVETTDEETGETSLYFDWLEGSSKIMSGEASVAASPGGDFFYALWNQETINKLHEVIESDAWFRRVMFLDEDVVTPPSGGDGPPADGPPKPGRR